LQAAQWYSDPLRRHQYRYWNGSTWTEHVSDAGKQSLDPPTPVTASTANSATGTHKPFSHASQIPWSNTKRGNLIFGWTAVALIGGLVLFLAAIPTITGAPASNSTDTLAPSPSGQPTAPTYRSSAPDNSGGSTGSAYGAGKGSALLVSLDTGQRTFGYGDCNAMFDVLNAQANSGTTESDRSEFIAGCQAFDGDDYPRP
jgi:hypothetical protein